jgi:hypothetical protein
MHVPEFLRRDARTASSNSPNAAQHAPNFAFVESFFAFGMRIFEWLCVQRDEW